MERFRRHFFLFTIIYIVFLHYGHAKRDISELKLPKHHHSLFDPLDNSLQGYKIQMIIKPGGQVFSEIKKYYVNNIEDYFEILEKNKSQQDDGYEEINDEFACAVLPGNDNKNKYKYGKYLSRNDGSNYKIHNKFAGQHNLDLISDDYEDWRLDFLNNLRNQPASGESYLYCYKGIFRNFASSRSQNTSKRTLYKKARYFSTNITIAGTTINITNNAAKCFLMHLPASKHIRTG